MRILFSIIALISTFSVYSQIEFEKGYFIDNSGLRTDCLIRNVDWESNPSEFRYKMSEGGQVKVNNIESIEEFGVENTWKYIRREIKIDRSSEIVGELSESRMALFQKDTLFLKALIEGEGSLYHYQDGNLKRFFFSTGNSEIEQLVFKSYITSSGKIGKNNQFKQQLSNALKCKAITGKEIEILKYEKRNLIPLFEKYNQCKEADFINYGKKIKRDLFNLSIRPRINNSSLSVNNSISNSRDTDFGDQQNIGFGIEAEFILPFNKNKWAIIVEPTYQYFESQKETASVEYKSIEVPLGIRHYFFLNENSKIMVNTSFVFDFMFGSKLDFNNPLLLDLRSGNNLAYGVGYEYKETYNFELRYQGSRSILTLYDFWNSEFKTLSLILGYSIF